MCGIVGFSGFGERSLLSRMNSVQIHRGPDEEGEYWDSENCVGLAMRRLSIVDIAGGRQPMANEDGSVILVFNGEIFNAAEIRKELEQKGRHFATDHSDTEVVLRLYEDCGMDTPRKLNGMFAFVIYDRKRKLLFGARDPFGIKPLYLHEHSRGMAWASELKSLHGLPTFSRELDPQAVEQYLGLQYIPPERSIFSCVKKLRPGHFFVYLLERNDLNIQKYYEMPLRPETGDGFKLPPNTDEIRTWFQEAVKRWSMSDVPIACSLSGGIDSGAVVASLARSGHKVKTYTLGYEHIADESLSELAEARQIAGMYGTEHHEITVEADDLIKALPDMVWHLDEPYGGGLPSWYVFREIANDVKVAMTGVGGDELFTNYNKFYTLEMRPYFKSACAIRCNMPRVSSALAFASRQLVKFKRLWWSGEDEFSVRKRHEKEDAPLFWRHPFGICYPTAHGCGFNERISARKQSGLSTGRHILEQTFEEYAHLSLRDRCVAVDFNNQLPDEFLHMTDRFSMAFSLEARTPFLDKEFVRFVFGIDASFRFTPLRPKSIFKNAFKGWLPEGYTELRKRGFVIPAARWLRGTLRNQAAELFSESALRKDSLIRPDFSSAYYKPFLEGQTGLTETLWTVFMFRLWQEHAFLGK